MTTNPLPVALDLYGHLYVLSMLYGFLYELLNISIFINECQRSVMYALVIEYGNKYLVYLWV